MTVYETTSLICPGCAAVVARVNSDRTFPPPADGDTAICVDCSQICVFTTVDGKLAFRVPTSDEFVTLIRDPDVQAAILRVRNFRENYMRGPQ